MRLTTLILIATMVQVSAAGFAQNITMNQKNVSLKQVFNEINKQTGYNFLWSAKKVKNLVSVDVSLTDVPLNLALAEVLKGLPLNYSITDKTILIKENEPSFLDKVKSRFFDISVSGVVLDSAGKPLPGASVTVKGTLKAVTTGDGGSFYLKDIKEGSTLVISYVGYATQEVKPIPNTLMQIKMLPSSGKLQEVVVNAGYYTVKEAERTGSISRITSREIEKQPVTNILAAMQGQMAGINITQVSGVPGGAFKVEIRGRNNVRRDNTGPVGNEPLYIIDGMPFSSQQLSSTDFLSSAIFAQSSGLSPLNGINPSDIESLEILKDADATAIYGSRGANGVVLITTKKGKSGKTSFSANAYSGASKVTRLIKMMNTQQYLEMRREGHKNDGTVPQSYEYDLVKWDQNRYTDWQKELIGGTSHTNNINATVSGGSRNTTFLMSGTYNTQGTVFPGDFEYSIGAIHFNMNHKSEDQRFSASLSGQYVVDKNNLPRSDFTAQTNTLSPNAPALYQSNGELNWENNTWENPLAALESKYLANSNTLTANNTLNYKILPGLEIKANFGFVDKRLTELATIPSTSYSPFYNFTSAASNMYVNNAKQQSWNIEPQLNWNQNIGKGLLSILAGATFQKTTSSQLVNSGSNFISNSLITTLSAATNQRIFRDANSDTRYSAIFGRINYNWNGKYILNLTGRRDGSSRFGPGKQFGDFGAIGAAWLFGKETIVNSLLPTLSFGKLRVSYGSTGSSEIPDYGFLNTYKLNSGSNYQGTTGLAPNQLYNPDFSWGITRKLDLGLNLGFINDRISLALDYYCTRSSNQLVGYQLPGTTGFLSVQSNLDATVQNMGWEFELSTQNLQGNLKWSTSFNLSINRNKLVSFPGLAGSTYNSYYAIGQPLNIAKVYHYTGVDEQSGIYTFQDYSGDGVISGVADRINFNLNPKYQGGLTNSLSYKNFEIEFLFQFVKQKLRNYIVYFGTPGTGTNQPIYVLDRWQKAGDDNPTQRYTSTVGDLTAYNAYNTVIGSDANFSDASFIRLKNLSLTYTLPKSIIKVASCRIYVQAQNLLTITNYKGSDPENGMLSALPPLRVITAGLQLNF